MVFVILESVENVLYKQNLPPEIDMTHQLGFTRLNSHDLEVLTKHSPFMFIFNEVANCVKTPPELCGLKPMLHDGGQEEAISKFFLMLGELSLLFFDL